jgi:hypothetical protein
MKKIILVSVMIFVFSLAMMAVVPTYIGAKNCKMCHFGPSHGGVYEKWEASKHVGAFKALNAAKGEDKNPVCLDCHTTGFKKGGYEVGAANAALFEGVQCESCHGAGSEYKKMSVMKDKAQSLAAGMVLPKEAQCKACHNEKSPNYKGFNFAEAYKKIDHKVKK